MFKSLFKKLGLERNSSDKQHLSVDYAETFFDDIVGYADIKKIFMQGIISKERFNILLAGPPGSAKTLFLLACKDGLDNVYFADNNSTGPGLIDYLFEHPETEYLLIDEFEKLKKPDQNALLNLAETGILVSTKVKKTMSIQLKTKIFATLNDFSKLSNPMKDRFYVLILPAYTEDEFHTVVIKLLTKTYKKSPEIAAYISFKTWHTWESQSVRDAIKLAKITGTTTSDDIEGQNRVKKEVDLIVNTKLKYGLNNILEDELPEKKRSSKGSSTRRPRTGNR